MITCQVDGDTLLPEGENPCHQCGADLSSFWKIRELPRLMYNKGLGSARSGALDEAAKWMSLAQLLDPEAPGTYIVLGKIHARRRELAEAERQWSSGLRVDPENRELKGLHENIVTLLQAASQQKDQEEDPSRDRTGQAVFLAGMVLFILPASYAILTGLHYSEPEKTRILLTLVGLGAVLILIGLNRVILRERLSAMVPAGGILAVMGVGIFMVVYPDQYLPPVPAAVLMVYTLGTALLCLSLVSGLTTMHITIVPVKGGNRGP
jgi:hypothetical protein